MGIKKLVDFIYRPLRVVNKFFLLGAVLVSITPCRGINSYVAQTTSQPTQALYIKLVTGFTSSQLSNGDSLTGYVTLGNNSGSMMTLTTSGTVTFNTVGRVDGTLASNGSASILLQDDMACGGSFATTGHMTWQGNGYKIRLLSSLTLTGANCWEATSSNLVIDGQGQSITLNGANALRIDAGVSVTLRNMNLVLSNLNPIWLADHSSVLVLDNVNVIFNVSGGGTYSLNSASSNGGQFWVANNVTFCGVGKKASTTFSYNSNNTLGIGAGAQLTIGDGVNFSYGGGSNNQIIMVSAASKLRFDNSTLTVPSGVGLKLLKGMLVFDNLCHIVNTGATSSTGGVVLGDGTSYTNNVDLRLLGDATLIVDGYLGYNFMNRVGGP